jgi:hypothetical protein
MHRYMATLGDTVEALVRKLVLGETSDPFNLRSWVIQHGALPVSADMGGCFAITRAGDVVSFLWDADSDLRTESDGRIRRIIVAAGSRHYPELAPFVPDRPPDAVDCRHCRGTGRPKLGETPLPENIVCYCGGLGWLLPNEDAP